MLRTPQNPLAPLVIAQLDTSVYLFTSLIQHGASTPRYQRNLQSLLQLRALASSKFLSGTTSVQSSNNNGDGARQSSDSQAHVEAILDDTNVNEGMELVGWRTRLVERVGQGRRTRTSNLATAPSSSSDLIHKMPRDQEYLPEPSPLIFTEPQFHMLNQDSTLTSEVVRNIAELQATN